MKTPKRPDAPIIDEAEYDCFGIPTGDITTDWDIYYKAHSRWKRKNRIKQLKNTIARQKKEYERLWESFSHMSKKMLRTTLPHRPTMTNKELQDLLKQYPDDSEVFIHAEPEDDFYVPYIRVYISGDIIITKF